jgi:streptogramin lyase
VIEYPLPDAIAPGSGCTGCGRASVGVVAAGADGNIWFADPGHRAFGRITPSGAITETGLPASDGDPYAITAGPDGNIWLTTSVGGGHPDFILRIGPGDTVTPFQAGVRIGGGVFGTGPERITSGPDGNLWFTEFWTNRIGRMTPAGVLTEFPIPTPDSAPRGIVTGPDGNLWFVESAFLHTAIARMTTAGVVTEYPLGGSATDQLQPVEIVTGADGNLWFNQPHPSAPQGEVGRITPSGGLMLVALPNGGRPSGLAVGPDGNIWFTDSGANVVGRITPAGVMREFALPARSVMPQGIAAGSDGRMWFAEGGKLASIGLTVPDAGVSARVVSFGSGAAVHSVDVTNVGEGDLRIDGVALIGSDRAAFAMTQDGCTGRFLPAFASCRIDVSFVPGAAQGLRAAQLAITDNATGSPHVVSLVAQLPDCKLPLFTSTSEGEFLSLRDGGLVVDSTGRFVTNGTRSQSVATPVIYGQLPATYDRVAKRWVPAGAREISPDGSRYAYIDYSVPMHGQLHVVDLASGLDRPLPTTDGPWGLLGFTPAGIYMHQGFEGPSPGLTLVSPDSGAVQTVFTDAVVNLVSSQVAWIVTRNASDTLPPPPGIGASYNEVDSRDLGTSKTTTWVYRPGSNMYVLAAANGSIVVQAYDQGSGALLVVSAPGQAQPVTVAGTGAAVPLSGALVSDATGWWMGSPDGLFLWTPRTGAVLVSELTASPAGQCA